MPVATNTNTSASVILTHAFARPDAAMLTAARAISGSLFGDRRRTRLVTALVGLRPPVPTKARRVILLRLV